MNKVELKGSVLLAPLPVALVSCGTEKNANVITIAWCGVASSHPPKIYVSVRKERYSYEILKSQREFCLNLVSEDLVPAADWCGFRSGKDCDKFAEMGFEKQKATQVSCPMIAQSPVSLECRVEQIVPLGSHDMFIAEVVASHIDEDLIEEGRINFEKARLATYQHGEYYRVGRHLARFGFSIQKKYVKLHGKGVSAKLSTPLAKRKQNVKSVKK